MHHANGVVWEAVNAADAPTSALTGATGASPACGGARVTTARGGRERTVALAPPPTRDGKCRARFNPSSISNCACRVASCVMFKNRLCADMDKLLSDAMDDPGAFALVLPEVDDPSRRWKIAVWIARDAVYTRRVEIAVGEENVAHRRERRRRHPRAQLVHVRAQKRPRVFVGGGAVAAPARRRRAVDSPSAPGCAGEFDRGEPSAAVASSGSGNFQLVVFVL